MQKKKQRKLRQPNINAAGLKMVSFRITPEQHEAIRDLAKRLRMKQYGIVEAAITEYLRSQPAE